MQTYETIIVVHSRLSDEEIASFLEKTKQFIAKEGGEVLGEDRWGRRKLAYPIRRTREGYYLYIKFQSKGSLIGKLNSQFRIQENILRSLTVQAEVVKANGKKPRKPKPAVKPAAAPKAAAK